MIIDKGNSDTPYINLDTINGKLTIMGKSYLNHPSLVYEPIISEIDKQNLNSPKITIKIGLEIMNSTSTQYIFRIISILQEMYEETVIYWYYEDDDTDLEEVGDEFEEMFSTMTFKKLPYPVDSVPSFEHLK